MGPVCRQQQRGKNAAVLYTQFQNVFLLNECIEIADEVASVATSNCVL
jgi:hypothetical protein